MDDKKKKYLIPEAETIDFAEEEIITLSGGTDTADEIGGADNEEDY